MNAVVRLFLITILMIHAISAQGNKLLLWKASSGKTTMYLLGSVHLASKDLYPLAPEIESAFASSDTLLVEVDTAKVDAKAMGAFMAANGYYQGEDTLWKHISEATADQFKKFCSTYGVPEKALEKLKPWVAAINVSLIPMMKSGMQPGLGIDQYFMDKAKAKSEPVEQIESAEWQLKLFSSQDDAMQEKYLAATLAQGDQMAAFTKQMESLWLSGDTAGLDAALTKTFQEPKELQRKIRQERNPGMADAAEKCAKAGHCFIVVGAAHLVGPESVLRVLEQRGYRVEQISTTGRKTPSAQN